jgi:hypothetical protein
VGRGAASSLAASAVAAAAEDDTVPVATTRSPAHAAPAADATATLSATATSPVRERPGRGAGLGSAPTSVSLTRAELAATVGIGEDDVADLERYGLITGRVIDRETIFNGDDMVVARAAAGFLRYGVEARHLRMYKIAAEREAGFVEQIVMPMAKQHSPTARQQAGETVEELGRLGEQLRSALMHHLLGRLVDPG